MDMGAFVIVVNAEKVIVTGDKANQKMYRRHTGRPGSLKEENFKHLQAVCASFFPSACPRPTSASDHCRVILLSFHELPQR